MSNFISSKNLEHAHTGSIEVEVTDVVGVELLRNVLHNLDPIYLNLARLVLMVEEVKDSVLHDWMSLLSNYVTEWAISLKFVFSIELHFFGNLPFESNSSEYCLGQAVLVDDWRYSWQTVVMDADI